MRRTLGSSRAVVLIAFVLIIQAAAQLTSTEERLKKLGIAPFGTTYNPNTAPGDFSKPVEVINVFILQDIMDLDEKTRMAHIEMEWAQWWHDDRLSYTKAEFGCGFIRLDAQGVTFAPDKAIWTPSIYEIGAVKGKVMETMVGIASKENEKYNKDKNVRIYTIYEIGIRNNFDFSAFPFDAQTIRWMGTGVHMEYEMMNGRKEVLHQIVEISTKRAAPNGRWDLVNTHMGAKSHKWFTGNVNTLMVVDLIVARVPTSVVMKSIVPMCMVVVGSSLSFWITPQAVPARTAFGVTMLLVGVAQQQAIAKDLPQVNYLTYMDVFALICIIYLSAVLIVFAVVHHRFSDKETMASGAALDQKARLWHPASYLGSVLTSVAVLFVMTSNVKNAPMEPITLK